MNALSIKPQDRITAKIFGSMISGTVNAVTPQDDNTVIDFTDEKGVGRWAFPYQIQTVNDQPIYNDAITEIIQSK